jgi:hypothetical protein
VTSESLEDRRRRFFPDGQRQRLRQVIQVAFAGRHLAGGPELLERTSTGNGRQHRDRPAPIGNLDGFAAGHEA